MHKFLLKSLYINHPLLSCFKNMNQINFVNPLKIQFNQIIKALLLIYLV